MIFSGKLNEYAGLIKVCNGGYFKEGIYIREISTKAPVVTCENQVVALLYRDGEIWYTVRQSSSTDDEPVYATYHVRDDFSVIEKYPCSFAKAFFVGNNIVNYITENDERIIYIEDCITGEKTKKNGRYIGYAYDNESLYFRGVFERQKCLICMSQDALDIKWTVKLEKDLHPQSFQKPMLYGDLVILNHGADRKSFRQAEIAAYSKKDGCLVWNRILSDDYSCKANNCLLVEDKLYWTSMGRIYILEASSGKILVDEPTGAPKEYFDVNATIETVWADGDTIFLLNYRDKQIKLLSPDAKDVLQIIKIPGGYAPDLGQWPTKIDETYYIKVVPTDSIITGAKYGLLELKKTYGNENPGPIIKIADWPQHSVEVNTIAGEEEYLISVDDDDIDRVINYGEILLKETAFKKGKHFWDNETTRNHKFNGTIRFTTDRTRFSFDIEDKLQSMCKRALEELGDMVVAGNGKSDIEFFVES